MICNKNTEHLETGNEKYIEMFYILSARYSKTKQDKTPNNPIPNLLKIKTYNYRKTSYYYIKRTHE